MRTEPQHGKNDAKINVGQNSSGDCVNVINTNEFKISFDHTIFTENFNPEVKVDLIEWPIIPQPIGALEISILEDPCDEADRMYYESLENEK